MAEAASNDALVKRAFLFLEDGEWDKAKEYSERILDENPEDSTGYLIALMADRQISKKEDLGNATVPLRESKDFGKALRYGDAETVSFLQESDNAALYQMAEKAMQGAKTEEQFLKAQELFDSVGDFRDAVQKSSEAAEQARDARLQVAKDLAAKGKPEDTAKAIETLKGLEGFKDSDQLKSQYENALAEQTKQAKSKRTKIIIAIVVVVAVIAVAVGAFMGYTNAKNNERAAAIEAKLAGMTFVGDSSKTNHNGDKSGKLDSTSKRHYEYVFASDGTGVLHEKYDLTWSVSGIYASHEPADKHEKYDYDFVYKVECTSDGVLLHTSNNGEFKNSKGMELTVDESDNPISFVYTVGSSRVICEALNR